MAKRGPDRAHSDEEILAEVLLTPGPVALTSEIAAGLTIDKTRVGQILPELEDKGLLESKLAGNSRIWWLTLEGERRAIERVRQMSTAD